MLHITSPDNEHFLDIECNFDIWHGGDGLTWCIGGRMFSADTSSARLQTFARDSAPSLALMLLTQPPCSGVTLSETRPESGTSKTMQVDSGIRLGEFVALASVIALYHSRSDEAITGHEEWRLCGKSIDEMTGWAMLHLLKAPNNAPAKQNTLISTSGTLSSTLVESTSAMKVLGTYELLEIILLHLPLRQLLNCQRVNRAFQSVFEQSQAVRRALFFEPPGLDGEAASMSMRSAAVPGPYLRTTEVNEWKILTSAEVIHPILNPFAPLLRHGLHSSTYYPRKEGAEALVINVECPMSPSQMSPSISSTLDRFRCCFTTEGKGLTWLATRRSRDDSEPSGYLAGPDKSLQRMLMTYPPVREVQLRRFNSKPDHSGFNNTRVQRLHDVIRQQHLDETRDPTNPNGVRFADFVKAVTTIAALVRGKKSASEIHIVGGESMRLWPKSVDNMTGWEMLRFFEIGEACFRAEQGMDQKERLV
ncbi:hypothetical protein LTR15_000328 [Elasticomyces elasticus]|nr:hypothetical protein LTR15_000328 [Elasticomyces elasticus]